MNLQMFLLEEGKVKSSSLKYYLKWIDLYKQQQCETGRFYDLISSNLQDWQINQAMNAVHLYNIFKSDTKKPRNPETQKPRNPETQKPRNPEILRTENGGKRFYGRQKKRFASITSPTELKNLI